MITNHKAGDILEQELKKMKSISKVKIGSPDDINKMTERFLSSFNCIIYDLCDYGFLVKHDKVKEIEQYIKKDGGSFLVTHDQWDNLSGNPLYLIGLEYSIKPTIYSNKARVCYTHELFNSYYDFTNLGKINIATTHQTNHKIIEEENNKARSIIELEINRADNYRYNYLVVNELGCGRIAYWAAGHSHSISKDEKKLFRNIVAWLTKYKKK